MAEGVPPYAALLSSSLPLLVVQRQTLPIRSLPSLKTPDTYSGSAFRALHQAAASETNLCEAGIKRKFVLGIVSLTGVIVGDADDLVEQPAFEHSMQVAHVHLAKDQLHGGFWRPNGSSIRPDRLLSRSGEIPIRIRRWLGCRNASPGPALYGDRRFHSAKRMPADKVYPQ